jgi:predicted ATPase
MPIALPGSTWKKWDLHVHTPDSLIHNYPGEKEAAWEAFISDLERLPPEFKVLGINDYLFVDGYERILRMKQQGRLANIDLLLPVIELRLDKFGGLLERDPEGAYIASSWSRINLHVIFDQLEPALIREQFIPAISRNYTLIPGATDGQWGGILTRDNLTDLGNRILESMPAEHRARAPAPLKVGFNNLNVNYDAVKEALDTHHFKGKHLIAIGKTEWDNLRWNDHTIADKKTVINEAHLVFTAAENPARYERSKAVLKDANVNSRLLDCSDAHSLSTEKTKDRIGNCFSWIKADPTFEGLLQAIAEFDDRVFIGDNPPKRHLVDQNKTKFIRSVSVKKKAGSGLAENWFDLDIPLNPDLVAIIGNKGSGKSALSDIIALAGSALNYASFSFLNPMRFRNPRARLAQHFEGTLEWHDGNRTSMDLDKDPDSSSVERVKYLPQSYLEVLCNELGEKGSSTFDAELRKIIYSHVPDEDRLGQPSMDDLLKFRVAEINQARQDLRQRISKVNADILETERRLFPEFKKNLEEQLSARKAELAALEESKPQQVDDPNTSAEALEESKRAAADIEELERILLEIDKEAESLREAKAAATKRQAVARRISQALANQKKQHETFLGELNALIGELGVELPANSLIQVQINPEPADSISKAMQVEIEAIDTKLQSAEPESISKRREQATASVTDAKSKLGERQRQFVLYKEALASWEKSKVEIIGAADKPGTITWLSAEIESLGTLPERLAHLRAKRAMFSGEIHGHTQAMVNEYQRLYGPVQAFVQSAQQMDMRLPLEFHVRIEEAGFEDQFFNRLNRQIRGTFCGIEESSQLLRDMLQETGFTTAAEAVAFAEKIDSMLHSDQRDGQQGRDTRFIDQLRKGVEPAEVLDYLFGLDYLSPRYSLTYDGQEIGQLSPGERGLLLLVFYLLVDKEDIPIVIDQPEENLDNQTIFRVLVKCIKKAKERRQVIMVTHNPNLAVVCDAEQIIFASCDKAASRFEYESGAIEQPEIKDRVVQILEGTEPAFKNRQEKYRLL